MIRFLTTISILIVLTSCGFKPMYKLSESSFDFRSYSIVIMNENDTSREIKEEIRKSFPSSSEIKQEYVIEINTIENLEPLITNTDGTIAKYRIDISTNFTLYDRINKKEIFSDYSKGFAQYETQTNNYNTEQKRYEAKKIATINSLQLIPIKIQNFQSR